MPFLTLRRFRFRKESKNKTPTPEPDLESESADPLAFSVMNLVTKPQPKRTGSVYRSGSVRSHGTGDQCVSPSDQREDHTQAEFTTGTLITLQCYGILVGHYIITTWQLHKIIMTYYDLDKLAVYQKFRKFINISAKFFPVNPFEN